MAVLLAGAVWADCGLDFAGPASQRANQPTGEKKFRRGLIRLVERAYGRFPFIHAPVSLGRGHGRFTQFCQAINGKEIIPLPISELGSTSFREYKNPLAVAVHLNGVAHPEYDFCFWLQ